MTPTRTAVAAALCLLVSAASAAHAAKVARGQATMTAGEDEYQVAYQIRKGSSSKPPVVFVHGWCASGSVWNIQLDQLKTPRALIAIDLIGHGDSDAPEELNYSMDTLADSIKAVLDHLELDEAVLVGHSNGTPTIRAFYNKYPDSTEALVTVDGQLFQIFTASQVGPILTMLQGEGWQQFLESQLAMMTATGFEDQQSKELIEIAVSTPQHVAIGTLEGSVDEAIWTDQPIKVPLLVVNAESPFWNEGTEAQIRAIAPKLEYHLLDQATHYLLIDSSDRFNQLVERFLKGL